MSDGDWDGVNDRRRDSQLIKEIRAQRVVLGAIIVSFTIMVGAIAVGLSLYQRDQTERRQFGVKLLSCLLEENAEHRQNTKEAQKQIARELGFEIEFPNQTTKPEDLTFDGQSACEEFRR